MNTLMDGLVLGVFATLVMDVSSFIGSFFALTGKTRPSLIGRWFGYLLKGKISHQDIRETPPLRAELFLGIVVHYLIGVSIGVGYLLLSRHWMIAKENWLFPVAFGLMTCAFPWFVLFPSCGFGLFGLKGPAAMRPLRTSVYTHFFYGIALFGYWRFLEELARWF